MKAIKKKDSPSSAIILLFVVIILLIGGAGLVFGYMNGTFGGEIPVMDHDTRVANKTVVI